MTALADVFPVRFGGYWGVAPGEADLDALAIRNGDVGTAGSIDWAGLPTRAFTAREASKALVKSGDILLTTSGNCGNVAFVDSEPEVPTLATNFVRVLRVDPTRTHARFAFHYLRTRRFREEIAPFVRGATIKNLSVESAFGAVSMPLPPLPEQRRIAAILDQADALRTKRRQALAHIADLTHAVFRDLFSARHDPVSRLDELIDETDRMNYGIVQPGGEVPGGVPLIRISNLASGVVDRSALKHVSSEVEAAYRRSRIRGNEILVSSVGTIGIVSVVRDADVGSNIARAITRVPITDTVLRTYVATYLTTEAPQRYFVSELRTVAQPTLNVRQLAATEVPVPPADLQKEFVRRLQYVNAVKSAHGCADTHDEELFAALQSRAFWGNL